MARKSRKDAIAQINAGNAPQPVEHVPAEKLAVFSVGLYARLSIMEKRDRKENEALENQKKLLREYIEDKPEFELYKLYADNGETGTNFERPAFRQMMADVRDGKVDCIIVKDLSRFARDHIEAGNYLENIFPFCGVRFISILDHYDSADQKSGEGFQIALKNLMNEVYAKDIAKKSGSALRTKMLKGEYIGDSGPYGYRKDPNDKHKLIVDPEAAEVVRRIFSLAQEGMSVKQVVKTLNEEQVLSPGTYKHQKGIQRSKSHEKPRPWTPQTLSNILRDPMYLGHMVQGRRRSLAQDGGPSHCDVPPEEWIIVQNTHEPIITKEQFDAVQAILEERRQTYFRNREAATPATENLFAGLVFCGDCGRRLQRKRRNGYAGKTMRYFFNCSKQATKSSEGCVPKFVYEDDLVQAVRLAIWIELQQANELRSMLTAQEAGRRNEAEAKKKKALDLAVDRIKSELSTLMEDYLGGRITSEEYQIDKQRLQTAQRSAEHAVKEWGRRKYKEKKLLKDRRWLNQFNMEKEPPELTREVLETLVDKIIVTGRDEIEIVFRYQDQKEWLFELIGCVDGAERGETDAAC